MRTCSFNHKEIVYEDGKYPCPLCDVCEKVINLRLYLEKVEGRARELEEQNTRLKHNDSA